MTARVIVFAAVFFGAAAAQASAQDAAKGAEVYGAQKCAMCHSIAGKGGKLALDGLARSGTRDFLTAAEQEGRRRVLAVTEFMKTLPAFGRAFVSHVAPQVGVRESRRVIGRYQLTRDDVLSGRKFDDAVARASWPIELWEEGRLGATYEYPDDGQTYDIPLRSLQARDVDNLFVAGRCMSATHEALGSARVIGTCLATGEAVGRAAACMAASLTAP